MNKAAIFHRPTREFIYPVSRNELFFRFYSANDDIQSATVIYWKRNTTPRKEASLKKGYSGFSREDFSKTILFDEPVHYIKYYFSLCDSSGNRTYLTNKGVSDEYVDGDEFNYLCVGERDYVSTPGWAQSAIWYQIFPDRFNRGEGISKEGLVNWDSVPKGPYEKFGGTLRGILEKVDYLSELGVTALYLCPIFKAEFNHKYATTDYLQLDSDFGTENDLKSLVTSLHSKGIRIILDGVFNHTGRSFFAFRDIIAKGKDSEYLDWYFVHSLPIEDNPLSYECVGDYGPMPKLNTANENVQRYIIDVMLYWIREYSIDGWRLDVADEISPSLWTRVRNAVKKEYPEAVLIGETWGDAFALIGDGLALDSTMNYIFRDAFISFFTGKSSIDFFFSTLGEMYMKYPECVNRANYNLLGSHDTERILTALRGDRDMLRCAIAMEFFLPGSPAIYYGDEVGLEGGNDPDCRRGMLWGEKQDRSLFIFFKNIIALRKGSKELAQGHIDVIFKDERRRVFALKNSSMLLVMNISDNEECMDLSYLKDFEPVLSHNKANEDYCEAASVKLGAKSFVILKRRMIK